jgi:hypothetical protein
MIAISTAIESSHHLMARLFGACGAGIAVIELRLYEFARTL